MNVTIDPTDWRKLSLATRNELISLMNPPEVDGEREEVPIALPPPQAEDEAYRGLDMTNVKSLTAHQVRRWMSGAAEQTKRGLRVFAEKGPIIPVKELTAAGITNYSHFQGRTTVRTRTVTGDKGAFLLGWSNTEWDEAEEGEGQYAVTRETFESLRRYFGLTG